MIDYDYVQWFQFLQISQSYYFVIFLSFVGWVEIFSVCDHYFSPFFPSKPLCTERFVQEFVPVESTLFQRKALFALGSMLQVV